MRNAILFLLVFRTAVAVSTASAQKPEFNYYHWGSVAPVLPSELTDKAALPQVLAETRIVEYASGSVFILIHRKVFYPGWMSLQAHRFEAFPGSLLKLQARLWDSAGGLAELATDALLQLDTQQQGGRIWFGARMPGSVLEYLMVTEMPHVAYLSQWYQLPARETLHMILVHPPELTLQYGVTGMQAGADRQNRDGKVITTLLLQRDDSSSRYQQAPPAGVRIIMRKSRTGAMPGWEEAAANVLRTMEQTINRKQEKQLQHISRKALQLQPCTQARMLAALPAMLRKEQPAYNHALMHRLLDLLAIEHQLVWTCDRFHPQPDPELPYLPDMTAMYLYMPGARLFFNASGQLLESVSDDFVACRALFIPAAHPELAEWSSLPLPMERNNRDIAEIVLNRDLLFQFQRHFKGRNADIFRQYGRLSASLRAETDIAVCRSLMPGAWLLGCRVNRMPDGETVFEGLCAAPEMVVQQDSNLVLNLKALLFPADRFVALPGAIWERTLLLPFDTYVLPAWPSLNDTMFYNNAAGVKTSFRLRRESKWTKLTLRMETDFSCSPDKIVTGSLGLPATIILRKKQEKEGF